MSININVDKLISIINSAIDVKLNSLQPTFTLIFTKLDSIDARLTNVETRLTNVETRLTNVENEIVKMKDDIKVLKDYNANESIIKEQRDSAALKKCLSETNHNATINMIKFGKFYEPYDNNPLTDIDGCVIVRSIPVHTINQNGEKIILDPSCVYLIESKHAITKTILDKKLQQFIIILELISKVQNNEYIPRKKKYKFDTTIATHNIKQWPKNIHFLFSTDKMTPTAIRLATAITTGTLSKNVYDNILFDNIKAHPIIQEIQNSETVNNYVKRRLNEFTSLDELVEIITPVRPVTATPKKLELYNKQITIMPFSARIKSLLVSINNYNDIVKVLNGKIGFINNNDIQLPESVIANGFNSTNRLLNMAVNA
jgi:uncharacterized protein YdcH (DUF465 family)